MIDRFKEIRKAAGLTQYELSDLLNVSRAYVGQVECGAKPLTDRTIRDVCRLLHVDEHWLRTGEGEPYRPKTRNQEIAEFVNSVMEAGDEDVRNMLIYAFTHLDSEDWEVLAKLVDKIKES